MVTNHKKHPLVLFERARELIGHKALIPVSHYRMFERMLDSGAMPAQALFEYARFLRNRLEEITPDLVNDLEATLPTVDVANLQIEADVCCNECRMFVELIPHPVEGRSPWIFNLYGAHDCLCFERGDIDQAEKDRVEALHDRLTEMEENQT